jgi:8-oxo-dGTP pyrophosphatase MutT (NUDIX family)
VVALDKKGRLVLVEQYRHPGEGTFIEFPGGSTDPGRREDPKKAAARELREETGFVSKRWQYLGFHYPNPALLTNRCHVFLARDCVLAGPPHLDPYEDLEVCFLAPRQFMATVQKSKKMHSLMLASFELARPYLGKL